MEILEVGVNEYAEVIKTPYLVFGSAAFNDLNRNKCDEVFYLLFREGKYRLGLVGGLRNNSFHSPFSAPFGSYSFLSGDIRLQYIEEAIRLLKNWAIEKRFSSISITIPPGVYDNNFIAKQINCFWREGFIISEVDLNYSFELEYFDNNYPDHIWHNARKNLRISLKAGLQFRHCTTGNEKKVVYDIISSNRESRGHPLHMSWEQITDTVPVIPADFFLVYTHESAPVASAIVFHVSESCVRVIYWGDLQGYPELKLMNFLAFKVFEYYKSYGIKIVELGISTEHSVPNYGLCEFKEGIGCRIDPQFTFIQKLA